MDEGILRRIGKYHADVFPFDLYLAHPWGKDPEFAPGGTGNVELHQKMFQEAASTWTGEEEAPSL